MDPVVILIVLALVAAVVAVALVAPRVRRSGGPELEPPATGGRFGPTRTTSSRASSTRTGRPARSASSRASAATGEETLPPNAPPLVSGPTGSPPGSHQAASGSR